ncbi:MAG: hypothetical protein J5I67_10785, partial [Ignavibacterium album]|nr:hypothetical protein [Ignavibacterium album]
ISLMVNSRTISRSIFCSSVNLNSNIEKMPAFFVDCYCQIIFHSEWLDIASNINENKPQNPSAFHIKEAV